VHGPEAFKQVIMRIHAGLSDVEAVSEEVIAEGDQVVVRWTLRGIHAGEIQGVPPTGKHLTLTGIGFYRLTERKIVEERGEEDALDYMQQLGGYPCDEIEEKYLNQVAEFGNKFMALSIILIMAQIIIAMRQKYALLEARGVNPAGPRHRERSLLFGPV
jgi:hypothetical protein